jgi:hypothetical protein
MSKDYERKTEMKGNYGRGPSTGNATARAGKREKFKSIKAERDGLADGIMRALENRAEPENEIYSPRLEGLSPYTRVKKFSK